MVMFGEHYDKYFLFMQNDDKNLQAAQKQDMPSCAQSKVQLNHGTRQAGCMEIVH